MSWVIAILLVLILVALMAADKSASVAVKKVIKVVLLGVALLTCVLAILAVLVWFHVEWAKEDWWKTGPVVTVVLMLSPLVWLLMMELAARFKKDMRGTLALVGKTLAVLVFCLLAAYSIKQTFEVFELSGWWIVICGLAFPGAVLLARSATSPSQWHEVWIGPAVVLEPWLVVLRAREHAESEERAMGEMETENWDSLSPEEQDAARYRRRAWESATRDRLAAISVQAETAYAKYAGERSGLNVRDVFWTFVLVGSVGLVPLYWQYGFEWAMTWKFVNGREWLAGALVVGGGLGLPCLAWELFEGVSEGLRGRQAKEDGAAKVG